MNATTKIEPGGLALAMAKAFAAIEGATKSANNPHFKSKYADLTSVIEAIKPALVENHLFFTQHPVPASGGIQIKTVLHHANGDSLELGELFVPANKNDAQAYGSALTYARRYALVTAFGVPVEDDDGNAASRAPAATPKQALIDDNQWAMLVQLIEASGADSLAFCKAYRIGNLKELPAAAFDNAVAKLNKKLAAREKADA